jgi:hypothetical protein
MTHKRTEIDRFGSQRRTKIESDRKSFFLGLCGRRHKHLLSMFIFAIMLQLRDNVAQPDTNTGVKAG